MTNVAKQRSKEAIRDLTLALELKPDFSQALRERGRLYMRLGQLPLALKDFENFEATNPIDVEGQELKGSVQEAMKAIQQLKQAKDIEQLELLNSIIQTSPESVDHRLQRAEWYESKGNDEMAKNDYMVITKLSPGNLDIFMKLVKIQVQLGELERAMDTLKDCVKSDPENKKCISTLRQTKKLVKSIEQLQQVIQQKQWELALKSLNDLENLVAHSKALTLKLKEYYCKAHSELKQWAKASSYCSDVLSQNPSNIDALIYQAEAKLANEEYDEAMKIFEKAHQLDQSNPKAREGYQKAQQLKRQAGRKDYYKVLGVSRDATTREIQKAYRKLSKQFHPDTYKGDLPKEEVVKKMSSINEAYEVLKNEELRARFDRGDDPNDNSQAGGFYGADPRDILRQFFQGGGGQFQRGFSSEGFPGGRQQHFKFEF